MIWKSFGYVVVATALASMIPACNTNGSDPSAEVEQTGEMRLPLEATAPSGNVYRLRNSLFFMSGPQGGFHAMPPDDDSQSFSQTVESGDYYIELYPGWQLWRMGPIEEPVEAALLSQNPTWASVFPQQQTVVTFKFQAGSDVIVFGPGELTVDIDVVEVSCTTDMDCGPGQYCQAGVCGGYACMGPWDCPGGVPCINGQCQAGAACGNGFVEPGEACDDGGMQDGDGCSSMCTLEDCGNLSVEPWEQCDDGNLQNGDGCSSSCTFQECGNGVHELGEDCDDGNTQDGDWCNADCTKPPPSKCANFVLEYPETCDDGNFMNGDGCNADCMLEGSACGDGVVDFAEVCDDGNNVNGDGCSADCTFVEAGFECFEPGQPCSQP